MAENQSDRFKKLRTTLGLSQQDVATKLQITQGAVSQFEKGGAATVDTLIRISNTYKVSLDWLILGKGEMFFIETKKVAPPPDASAVHQRDKEELYFIIKSLRSDKEDLKKDKEELRRDKSVLESLLRKNKVIT